MKKKEGKERNLSCTNLVCVCLNISGLVRVGNITIRCFIRSAILRVSYPPTNRSIDYLYDRNQSISNKVLVQSISQMSWNQPTASMNHRSKNLETFLFQNKMKFQMFQLLALMLLFASVTSQVLRKSSKITKTMHGNIFPIQTRFGFLLI